MKHTLWAAITFVVVFVSSASRPSARIPEKFTNLKTLPADIGRPALVSLMREFVFALNVRCEHCHVGEGNDLSKFDFAADTRAPKETAYAILHTGRRTHVLRQTLTSLERDLDPARFVPVHDGLSCVSTASRDSTSRCAATTTSRCRTARG